MNKVMKNSWFKAQTDLFELKVVIVIIVAVLFGLIWFGFEFICGLLECIFCPEILNKYFCRILSFLCIQAAIWK